MEIDITAFLSGIIENEGGRYELPAEQFHAVQGAEKALIIDYDEAKQVLILSLVAAEDIPEGGEEVDF